MALSNRYITAETLCNNDVIITSKRRHFDVITFWRYDNVIITSCVRWYDGATTWRFYKKCVWSHIIVASFNSWTYVHYNNLSNKLFHAKTVILRGVLCAQLVERIRGINALNVMYFQGAAVVLHILRGTLHRPAVWRLDPMQSLSHVVSWRLCRKKWCEICMPSMQEQSLKLLNTLS